MIFFSVTWNPMGAKASKRYSSLKSLVNPFKLFWIFLSVVLTKLRFEFLKFWVLFCQEFFSFSLTWGPTGAKISKRHSSLKSLLDLFNLFLNFLVSGPHKSTILDFWNFEFPIFNDFFLNFTIVPYGKPKASIIWKMSDCRAKRSEILLGEGRGSIQCTQGSFDTSVIRVILGSFGTFPIYEKTLSRKWLVVERNGGKFEPRGWVSTGYFWHLIG